MLAILSVVLLITVCILLHWGVDQAIRIYASSCIAGCKTGLSAWGLRFRAWWRQRKRERESKKHRFMISEQWDKNFIVFGRITPTGLACSIEHPRTSAIICHIFFYFRCVFLVLGVGPNLLGRTKVLHSTTTGIVLGAGLNLLGWTSTVQIRPTSSQQVRCKLYWL